uniref:Uncharacterized protein n=1 Tax=Anopheles atroparvus TaxID=41427 RepID=A0A182ITS2_ANOAO
MLRSFVLRTRSLTFSVAFFNTYKTVCPTTYFHGIQRAGIDADNLPHQKHLPEGALAEHLQQLELGRVGLLVALADNILDVDLVLIAPASVAPGAGVRRIAPELCQISTARSSAAHVQVHRFLGTNEQLDSIRRHALVMLLWLLVVVMLELKSDYGRARTVERRKNQNQNMYPALENYTGVVRQCGDK